MFGFKKGGISTIEKEFIPPIPESIPERQRYKYGIKFLNGDEITCFTFTELENKEPCGYETLHFAEQMPVFVKVIIIDSKNHKEKEKIHINLNSIMYYQRKK